MKLSQEQREQLRSELPNEAEKLIAANNVNDILDALDDLYLDLLDENQEPTEDSRRVERLRDAIHWDNYHKD